ncbi:MAG TPA: CBS domain-containing protein [Bdellovibrionota bacterium]|nr:CBS domain-containing protein [Bdellovibrionota bacterium]
MRLQDIMNPTVHTILPQESAEAAYQRMRQDRIHHLVVIHGKQVVGVVSERDLGSGHGETLRKNRTVGDFISTPAISAPPFMTVRQAANLMRGQSIGCLPVTDAKGLVGIVTISDLLELIGRGSEKPIQNRTRWTMRHRESTVASSRPKTPRLSRAR